MKFTTQELVKIAVFGALWGVIEISLGTLLKSLHVPLSGMVLAGLGLLAALTGRTFVPRRGAILFTGVIAMLLKLLSLGGIVIGPMVGILAEALIAEGVLSTRSNPGRWSFVLAGALGASWTVFQPLVTGPLLFGRALVAVWLDLLDGAGRLLGLDARAVVVVIGIYTGLHLLAGAVSGWMAWNLGQRLRLRLGAQAAQGAVSILLVSAALLAGGLLVSGCAGSGQVAPEADAPVLTVGDGTTSKTYTRKDLEALPQTESSFKDVAYSGVRLADLVRDAGFVPEEIQAVKAVAADGFSANYEPAIFNREDVIVAYARSDGELAEDEGPFRMVVPDAEGRLNVRSLTQVEVVP